MPELPEVETVRRTLLPSLLNQFIRGVCLSQKHLRYPVPRAKLKTFLVGTQITQITRRSKYLLFHLSNGKVMVMHLGMSGRLFLTQPNVKRDQHDHALFDLDGDLQLRYRDPRRFGLIDLLDEKTLSTHKFFKHLGPEPLEAACSTTYLYERSRGSKKPIKHFIMDARVVVGVGNIYANEALFLAGINPNRGAGRLSLLAWQRLHAAIVQVLTEALKQGGTTLKDFRDGNGNPGLFQVYLRVYQRDGEPCITCQKPIKRIMQSNRSTFYCTVCQSR